MPDVFLSYSRHDLAVASQMAAALMGAGHDVWWDQALRSGQVYDQVTETALREARVVVVLWSKAAVKSDWVRSEATVAMKRGALMPVMIEDCERPVMFELRQSADLIGWKGNAKDPRLLAFVADVTRHLGSAPAATMPVAPMASAFSRRVVIGGTAIAALAGAGVIGWRQLGGKADDGTASVVVLPFANLSSDPAQAFFSDGIAEELRNALSQIRGLKVIGRVSSEQFRDTSDLPAAAAKLAVDHVLTGSVRRSPTTIRIGAQLVDGRTGIESWSQSYDQPIGDALAIQSKIATSVVAALSAKLGKATGKVIVGGTENAQAQELFLKAEQLGLVGRKKAILIEQLALIDEALALDPKYSEAWALKGNITSNSRNFSTSAAEIENLLDVAMASSRRAVALAPTSGYAHMSLAIRFRNQLHIRQALAETEKALELSPADARVVSEGGYFMRYVDPDRAVLLTRSAVNLDPLNPLYLEFYSATLLAARRYADAADAARHVMALSNNQFGASFLVAALFKLGQLKEAQDNLRHIVGESTRTSQAAIIEAGMGNRAASDAALSATRKTEKDSANFRAAFIHAARGEKSLAIEAIEAAYKNKETQMYQIAIISFFDPIRDEPRFKAVQDAVIPPDLFVPPKRR